MNPSKPCPCKSEKTYAHCCGPFHSGTTPPTALQLMRSRFSAYALCLPEYILRTQNSEFTKKDREEIIAFSKGTEFKHLKILDFQEQGDTATVTFHAYLIQQGQDASFTEKSFFEKKEGKWLYQRGELTKGALP